MSSGLAVWPTTIMGQKAVLLAFCCLLQCHIAWCDSGLLVTNPQSLQHDTHAFNSRLGQDSIVAGQEQAVLTGIMLPETSAGSPRHPSATPGHPRNLQAATFALRSDSCETSWQKLGSTCYRYISGSWTQTQAAHECRKADSLGIATLAAAPDSTGLNNIVSAVGIPTSVEAWSGVRFHSPSQGEQQAPLRHAEARARNTVSPRFALLACFFTTACPYSVHLNLLAGLSFHSLSSQNGEIQKDRMSSQQPLQFSAPMRPHASFSSTRVDGDSAIVIARLT